MADAIDSVIRQSYDDLEIIVIDDGSTDDTCQVVARYGDLCRYQYQTNQGPAAARNRAIELAKGDVIALLDSDDLWMPGKIETELALFQRYPEADCLAGNGDLMFQGEYKTASIFAQRQIKFVSQQPRYFDWSFSIMPLGPACVTSAMTFKRSVLEKLGTPLFDNSLRFDEDWDLEFRLFSRCNALFYNDIVCRNRIDDDGTRKYYTIWGRQKTLAERQRIWRVQIGILQRYLDHPGWDDDTRRRFQQRHEELVASLNAVPEHPPAWIEGKPQLALPA